MSEYKYEVRSYAKQSDVHIYGSVQEIGCDTLKEAKAKAKYVLTEDSRIQSEASAQLGYSQVVNRFTGEVIADFFNGTICQECGQTICPAPICCDTCKQPV